MQPTHFTVVRIDYNDGATWYEFQGDDGAIYGADKTKEGAVEVAINEVRECKANGRKATFTVDC